jgi:hypothetical protein
MPEQVQMLFLTDHAPHPPAAGSGWSRVPCSHQGRGCCANSAPWSVLTSGVSWPGVAARPACAEHAGACRLPARCINPITHGGGSRPPWAAAHSHQDHGQQQGGHREEHAQPNPAMTHGPSGVQVWGGGGGASPTACSRWATVPSQQHTGGVRAAEGGLPAKPCWARRCASTQGQSRWLTTSGTSCACA